MPEGRSWGIMKAIETRRSPNRQQCQDNSPKSKKSPHLWTSLQRVLIAYSQVGKRVEFVKCVLECVPVSFLFLFCLLCVSPIRPMFHLEYFGHHFPPKLKVEFLVRGQR